MKPRQSSAQVMSFEARVGEVFGQAAKYGLNLRLECRVFGSQTAEGALKPGREGKLTHDSLGHAQTGQDGVGGA